MSFALRFYLLLAVTFAAVGCKRTPTDVHGGRAGLDLAVDTSLQLVVVQPAVVPPNSPTMASMIGAGFQRGIGIHLGEQLVPGVNYVDDNSLSVMLPGLPLGTYDVTVTNPDGGQSTLRGGLTVRAGGEVPRSVCPLVRVYFELDRSSLSAAARSTLDGQVGCYQAGVSAVRVEGHADERGTTDYNLALGQRRADSVRRHLIGKGVSSNRLSAVSYGEERPMASGSGEVAWSQNRRAEVHSGR
jgi:peptidoglycan-associated lipoprotein